jgi:hypothetical protein
MPDNMATQTANRSALKLGIVQLSSCSAFHAEPITNRYILA